MPPTPRPWPRRTSEASGPPSSVAWVSGAAITLLFVGGMFQFGGILAVAWPDLIPWKERLSRWLTDADRRAKNRLRRLFRRPPRTRTIPLSSSISLRASMSAAATVAVSDGAPLEDKVAFLLRRDQEAQQRENKVAARLNALEQEGPKRLDDARAELKRHYEEKLTEALNLHRGHRIWGAILLAAGLLCLVAASFV